jgi:hypothetical protein
MLIPTGKAFRETPLRNSYVESATPDLLMFRKTGERKPKTRECKENIEINQDTAASIRLITLPFLLLRLIFQR